MLSQIIQLLVKIISIVGIEIAVQSGFVGNYVKESKIKNEKIQIYISKNDNTIDGNIFDFEKYYQTLQTIEDSDTNKNLKLYISEFFLMLFN